MHLPYALATKYPNAAEEWGWQLFFLAANFSLDPQTSERRRHHIHKRAPQRAFHDVGLHMANQSPPMLLGWVS